MKNYFLLIFTLATLSVYTQPIFSGNVSNVVAGEEIPVFSAIYVNGDGVAFKAGRTEDTRAQGMAIDTAFLAGDTIQILYSGLIFDFPDLVEGSKYYVGTTDGTVVDRKPTTEYSQQIGRAVGRGVLLVEPLDINKTGETTVWRSSDNTRSNSGIATIDEELQISLESGVEYAFEAKLWFSTDNGTMGYKCGLDYSGTIDKVQHFTQRFASGGTSTTDSADTALPSATGTAQSSGVGYASFVGYINPSSGGTLSVTWSQNIGDAANISLLKGSYIKVTKK